MLFESKALQSITYPAAPKVPKFAARLPVVLRRLLLLRVKDLDMVGTSDM